MSTSGIPFTNRMMSGRFVSPVIDDFIEYSSYYTNFGLGKHEFKLANGETKKVDINLYDLASLDGLDIVIDGADEFDENLTLIKGGGGALVREKIIAQASQSMIVVADNSKKVKTLGKFPLPVEVIQFSWNETKRKICKLTGLSESKAKLRMSKNSNEHLITDNGNYILDLSYEIIANPIKLEKYLLSLAGVLDCGLFCGIASKIILASTKGIEIIEK